MGRTIPTEESLGLSPTDEELGTSTSIDDESDDIPLGDDPPAQALARPGDEREPDKVDDKPPELSAPDPVKHTDQPQMVDVRAVQEARAEAREAKQRAAILEQRWNDYLAAQQPKTAEPAKPAIPDAADPMGRVNWTAEQVLAMQEKMQAQEAEQARIQREEAAFRDAFAQINAEFTAAAQTDPSIREAYDVVREMRGKELMAFGLTMAEARAQLDLEERQQIMFVAGQGRSIVEHVKTMAELRGWRPKPTEPAPTQQRTADLAAVADAQQRHMSLSDAPGGEGVPPLDAKALARMSDKEFKAWMSKKGNEAKWDQIMGAG